MRKSLFALVAIAFASMSFSALADTPASNEDKMKVEAVLTKDGYTSWGEIAFDDDEDAWNVVNAVGADGNHYNLQLDKDMTKVTSKNPG